MTIAEVRRSAKYCREPVRPRGCRLGLSDTTRNLGLLPEVRRKAGGRRAYAEHEVERLRFIQRLKRLGLSLAEIKELSGIYAMAGSTQAMLERLQQLLGQQLEDVDGRMAELGTLRTELNRYQKRVAGRIAGEISS